MVHLCLSNCGFQFTNFKGFFYVQSVNILLQFLFASVVLSVMVASADDFGGYNPHILENLNRNKALCRKR